MKKNRADDTDELELIGDKRSKAEEKEAYRNKVRKKKRGRRGRRIAIFIVEFVALLVLFAGYYLLSKWDMIQHVEIEKKVDVNGNEIQQDNKDEMDASYAEKVSQGYINFAVFGCDSSTTGVNGRSTSLVSGTNTDVIMIVSINKDTGETRIASVYRDTVMYMPDDGTYNKINYAAAKWDVSSTLIALNQNLDLTLEDYISVNWTAVALAINLLGGVEVDVPEAMLGYINGYITETVQGTGIGSTQLTSAGYQTLDGIQAVAYCRVRYTDNDYMRTERQREVVGKMIEKAKQAGPTQLIQIADAVFKETATTFELTEIFEMCTMISDIEFTESTGYPFYKISMQYNAAFPNISWPCFAQGPAVNVSQLHEFLYDETDYQLTETAYQISVQLENMSGVSAPEETTAVRAAETSE